MPDECALEMKKTTHSLLATERRCVEEVMDCKHYGTFCRLARVTVCVLRAIQHFNGSPPSNQISGFSPNELASAEKLWILSLQGTLPSDKHFTSWQKQFNLFQDEHSLWHCGGQLANAGIPCGPRRQGLGCGCVTVVWNWDSTSTGQAAVPIGDCRSCTANNSADGIGEDEMAADRQLSKNLGEQVGSAPPENPTCDPSTITRP